MAQVKTNNLSGAALDWAVAKAGNVTVKLSPTGFLIYTDKSIPTGPQGRVYQPSTNWAQGGPIIEQEFIYADRLMGGQWLAAKRNDEGDSFLCAEHGPTPLIAAMRCFVASKLGDVVEIPEELC